MKRKTVIDDGGNEHVMLIPENEGDVQVAQSYTIDGIGDPNKKSETKRDSSD